MIKYLGVVPAKGSSHRLPRKNVQAILGKPLIYWSMEAGRQSKLIDRLVISTEDSSIKDIAGRYGIEVIDRPKSLSRGNSSLNSVLKHALKTIPAENVVVLRPTSPIRINNIIDYAINYYEAKKGTSLMTGFMNKEYEWFSRPGQNSQYVKGWFQGDGCVDIQNAESVMNNNWGKNPIKMVVPEMYNYEVDTKLQLVMIGKLMEYLEKEK